MDLTTWIPRLKKLTQKDKMDYQISHILNIIRKKGQISRQKTKYNYQNCSTELHGHRRSTSFQDMFWDY